MNGLMLILGVLWIESEQILHLNIGCLNFGPVRDSAIYPSYVLNDAGMYTFVIDRFFKLGTCHQMG